MKATKALETALSDVSNQGIHLISAVNALRDIELPAGQQIDLEVLLRNGLRKMADRISEVLDGRIGGGVSGELSGASSEARVAGGGVDVHDSPSVDVSAVAAAGTTDSTVGDTPGSGVLAPSTEPGALSGAGQVKPRLYVIGLSHDDDPAAVWRRAMNEYGYPSIDEDSVRVSFSAYLNPARFAAVSSLFNALEKGRNVAVVLDSDLIRAVVDLARHDASSPVAASGNATDPTVEDSAPDSGFLPLPESGAHSEGGAA